MKYLLVLVVVIVTLLSIKYYNNENAPHKCPFDKCPYKGVHLNDAKQAIINYTHCKEGTDAYLVDLIHFQHPNWDYEMVEAELLNR
jgi:hypothetical protein